MTDGPSCERIASEVRRLFREYKLGGEVDVDAVRSHFWPFAFHKWRATPHFDLASSVAQSVRPNPVRLPFLYCAGEAFSSYQAWIEGAIETAQMALLAADEDSAERATPHPPVDKDSVVYVEGRPIDVSSFSHVHPGEQAFRNHIGENVDDFMRGDTLLTRGPLCTR